MILADVAPQPNYFLPTAGLVGGLCCLLLVSAIVLTVVLVRRSNRNKAKPPAA